MSSICRVRPARISALLLAIHALVPIQAEAESPKKKAEPTVLARQVNSFSVKDATMLAAVKKLRAVAKTPIFISTDMKDKGKGKLALKVEGKSLREILDKLVEIDKRYYWVESHGIVNVLPKNQRDDKNDILNVKIKYLLIREVTTGEAFSKASSMVIGVPFQDIEDVETYEKVAVEYCFARPGYSKEKAAKLKRFSILVRNVTFRELLNLLAALDKNFVWTVSGGRNLRGVGCKY